MAIGDGLAEYAFTIGILVSFIGLLVGVYLDRKNIRHALGASGLKRRDLILVALIVIFFIALEVYMIKPTELLFFDDAIYQGMAADLLHMGQAWMCNYGSPTFCYSGQIFHEPIGLSFNIAISFLLLGVKRSSTYVAELALAALSVLMSFFVALLLFKDKRTAYFSALILACSPVLLVWAMPTNSDMATLAYSLVALFMMLVFTRRRSIFGLSNMLLSLSLVLYMKVYALIYVPIFAAMFLLLFEDGIIKSIKSIISFAKANILNTKFLIVVLLFIATAYPSILYALNKSVIDGYGYQGSQVQQSCNTTGGSYLVATSSINFANFKANICANVLFWANQYKSQYIMQPLVFTILAIIGVVIALIAARRRELAAIAIWFVPVFLLYTAFYAGSVLYGVDWRFMLGLIAQVAILAGFTLGYILTKAEKLVNSKLRSGAGKAVVPIIALIMVAIVLYNVYALSSLLSVKPSQIPQAPDARFYENFVYNSSYMIPRSCIVYTYDPTLFNVNNLTAAQMSDMFNTTFYDNATSHYSCSVIDVGYWCFTPNNLCTQAYNQFNMTPIAIAPFEQDGMNKTFGFYRITGTK